MTKIENKIIEFIKKHLVLFFIIIITLVAGYIRYKGLAFKSGDYINFLNPWFEELKNAGGLKGLATYTGDYNAPYVTLLALLTYIPKSSIVLIKSLSILFDFLLAFSCSRLVREITKGANKFLEVITYAVVIMLPTVILNGAYWAQCDSIYASFVVLSLLYLVKKKYVPSFILLGVAFAFKLQFIFILPLYIVLYFSQKEYSILHFLILPATNIILCLPAIIAGKPFIECMKIYFNQTQTYSDQLVLNFPSFYNLLNGQAFYLNSFATLLTITLCGIMLFYVLYKNIKFNNEKMLTLGLWFLVVVTYFLPGMHERYLFVGEILSIVLYLVYKKHISLMLTINIAAIMNYSLFLFGTVNEYMRLTSIILLVIIVLFTKETVNILNEPIEDNKKTSNC